MLSISYIIIYNSYVLQVVFEFFILQVVYIIAIYYVVPLPRPHVGHRHGPWPRTSPQGRRRGVAGPKGRSMERTKEDQRHLGHQFLVISWDTLW